MIEENYDDPNNVLVIDDGVPGLSHDADVGEQHFQASHEHVEEAVARVVGLA